MLLLIIGCVALEDRWEEAMQICDPPHPFLRSPTDPEPLGEACRTRLIEDFHIDADSFIDAGQEQLLDGVLEAAFQILGRDLSDVGELQVQGAVQAPLIELLSTHGAQLESEDNAQILYNLMSHEVEGIKWWEGQDPEDVLLMRAALSQSSILVSDNALDRPQSTLLVHELGHILTGPHHYNVDGDWFDEDWSGAWGVHAGVAALWRSGLPEDDPWHESWAADFEKWERGASSMIVPKP